MVQAALGKARDRKPYWPGPIDGDYPRHRKALGQSLAVFQQAQRLRPSGKINRLGSDVDRLESALPAGHRRMSGVPGTTLVRRRLTAAPAPAAEAAARSEATAPLPEFERLALASLQRDLYEAHKLYFTMTGVGVVGGGRFRVSLACPDSEWLDVRRNVFELGGKLPPALRKGLEGTLRGAARAWKVGSGDSPGLVLDSSRAFSALHPGAAPDRAGLEVLGIEHAPSDPTARACLAACLDLAQRGETLTAADLKQGEELAEAVGVIDPKLAKTVLAAVQTAQAGPSQQSQQQWVNPTGGALRGSDYKYGDGTFGARRRRKNGTIYSHEGQVRIIEYPYPGNFNIRYVEITSPLGHVVREFYVNPQASTRVGSSVAAGQRIGTHQSLSAISPGMPEHVHVEIRMGGVPIDPRTLIP